MRDFAAVAAEIIRNDPELAACAPAVEKELLHHELLGAMSEAGFLHRLVFKGGTCLRLCHGGLRLSEDLDFSGGASFDDAMMDGLESLLVDRFANRYGLDVSVKPPRGNREGSESDVRRWVARVVTRPAGQASRLEGVQRIKIEIDRRDHHPQGTETLPLQQRYAMLQANDPGTPIRAASMTDIGSDKLIALPMSVMTRNNPRHRDVWDLGWIVERTGDADGLVAEAARKAVSRGIGEQYVIALGQAMERMGEVIESTGFQDTLRRFLPERLAANTVGARWHRQRLTETVQSLCSKALLGLDSE